MKYFKYFKPYLIGFGIVGWVWLGIAALEVQGILGAILFALAVSIAIGVFIQLIYSTEAL